MRSFVYSFGDGKADGSAGQSDLLGGKGANLAEMTLIGIPVPAGFTSENLPVGITFYGPAYSESALLKFAYAYEQANHHRMPPKTTPALARKVSD